MNQMHASLGAITPDQLSRANQLVDELAGRLVQQSNILRQAETAGFDRGLVASLQRDQAGLLAQLQALTDTVPTLSTGAFEEWIARATGFEAQVTVLEQQVRTNLPGAERGRNVKIIGSTIAALALAGGVAALIWYGTKGR